MKRLAYIDPDTGILAIVVPIDPEADHAKAIPPGVPYREIDDVPLSRTFRNAWTLAGEAVAVDMPKARAIHLKSIREARLPLLAELDREWMKATGQQNSREALLIEAKRQSLRDLPATVNLEQFSTAEDLEEFWPDELKQE